MRFFPSSYFWICWNDIPSLSPSADWETPALMRSVRMRHPTCASMVFACLARMHGSANAATDTHYSIRCAYVSVAALFIEQNGACVLRYCNIGETPRLFACVAGAILIRNLACNGCTGLCNEKKILHLLFGYPVDSRQEVQFCHVEQSGRLVKVRLDGGGDVLVKRFCEFEEARRAFGRGIGYELQHDRTPLMCAMCKVSVRRGGEGASIWIGVVRPWTTRRGYPGGRNPSKPSNKLGGGVPFIRSGRSRG